MFQFWQLQFFVSATLFLSLWRPKSDNENYHVSDEIRREEEAHRRRMDDEDNEELRRTIRENLRNRLRSASRTAGEASEASEAESQSNSDEALVRLDNKDDKQVDESFEDLSETSSSDNDVPTFALREIPFKDSSTSTSSESV